MDQILKEIEKSAAGALSAFSGELAGVRTSRPSPALAEDIKIDYFGQQVPVKQLGSLSIVPPREMVISLWDPSGTAVVAKALEDSKRGFGVSVRGNSVVVTLPPLSQDRREELIKVAKTMAEQTKIRLRGLRDDANKKLSASKTAKTITEDMEFRGKKKVQETIDRANKDIEASVDKKIKEINE
jgi:ribosome recycling factor